MADVKWIKIAVDIFDDEKILLIEQMPEGYAVVTVWFKLLCLAGKQNNSGVFIINEKIPYTEEMFAAIFRMPLQIVRLALTTFEKFGMVEIINATLTIPKWGKHQSLDKLEQKNEYMRKYMEGYREKQRLITSGKVNSKSNSKANVSSAELELEPEPDKEPEEDKRKRPTPPHRKHGEYGWVRLTDEEHTRLLADLGETELARCIKYLDESAQGNGNKNKWKDWNLKIRQCARGKWGVDGAGPKRKNAFQDYDQGPEQPGMYETGIDLLAEARELKEGTL